MGTMVREDGTVFDDSVADLLETFPVENYPWFDKVMEAVETLSSTVHAQVLFLNGLQRKFPHWNTNDTFDHVSRGFFDRLLRACDGIPVVAATEQWKPELAFAMGREVEELRQFASRCWNKHDVAIKAADMATAQPMIGTVVGLDPGEPSGDRTAIAVTVNDEFVRGSGEGFAMRTLVEQSSTTALPLEWEVCATDEVGPGGAHHAYIVSHPVHGVQLCAQFQCGPRNVDGSVSGVFDGQLLDIVAHRLECFQNGPFACEENAEILRLIRTAAALFNQRAVRREVRGVLGKNVK